MKAMVLRKVCSLQENSTPLELVDLPIPKPQANEVLIKIAACGVCHTELDEIEGRTPPAKFPIVLGHQVVGTVVEIGAEVSKDKLGQRVGVAWIFSACGNCKFCNEGFENLCDQFLATGRDMNGGYAEYMTALEKYIYNIPDFFSDTEAAPLLCAGAIGYRSIVLARLKDGDVLGLTGFGASAHLVLKMVKYMYPRTKIFVFARKKEEREFARELGAEWAGNILDIPPLKMDCIIDTTPVWKNIVEALANLEKGGRLVINAIRKENLDKEYLQNLSYERHLWLEKEIKSVANITAKDVKDFLTLAENASLNPQITEYALEDANNALMDLKNKKIKGAKVLRITNHSK